MKLYFAGYSTDKEIFEVEKAQCLLESYLLFKKKDYKEWHLKRGLLNRDLFLDSGAFSAFTRKEKIDIDEYINFIKTNKNYITTYATLDVIGSYELTRKNTEYMESKDLNPLPVFHYGSPLSELERMIEKYDYIALGGLVPLSMKRKKLMNWLDVCFSRIMKKKPLVKVHGFGVNAFWAWKRYPFCSVDATSWLVGGKFRRIIIFENGKLNGYGKKDKNLSLNSMNTYLNHYTDLNRSNVIEYLKGADYITKLWEKRGISWSDK
jgi:hypothetical protein